MIGYTTAFKIGNYALLVEAFNSHEDGRRVLGLETHTVDEFSKAPERAMANRDGPTLIKCNIHQDDCSTGRELIT